MKPFLLLFLILNPLIAWAQVSQLNDEFNDVDSLGGWQNLQQAEGWVSKLEALDIDTITRGNLTMQPYSTTWYGDYTGPLIFKEVSGDFVLTTEVSVSNRAGNGAPSSPYSMAGIMLRAAKMGVNGAEGWIAGQENYVATSIGRFSSTAAVPNEITAPQLTLVDTLNSNLRIRQANAINASGSVLLRFARIGNVIISLYRLPGGDWTISGRLNRPDLPQGLQVGMMSIADHAKALTYSPLFHNSNTLSSDLNPDPSLDPDRPFRADLRAAFHFARFNTVALPSELNNVDLTSTQVSDSTLLGFLGFESTEHDFPEPELEFTLTVTNGSGDGDYAEGRLVNIAAGPAPPGQVFSAWTGDTQHLADSLQSSTVLTMPATPVNLSATYAAIPPLDDTPPDDDNSDGLARFNDEFDDATSLSDWQNLQQLEGWPSKLEHQAINDNGSGNLVMVPYTSTWYRDHIGSFLFKEVSGDFIFTTEISLTNRAGNDIPSALNSMAGIMLRFDQGTRNGERRAERYVSLDVGRGGRPTTLPPGTTVPHIASTSRGDGSADSLLNTIDASGSVSVRLARIGANVIALYRLPGGDWTVFRRYFRPDLPETLEVGMTAASDHRKAASYTPSFHNSNILAPGLNPDPSTSPNLAFSPDLVANFHFARFNEVHLPQQLIGIDLRSDGVSDEELLSFLGHPSATPPPGHFALSVSDGSGDGFYPAGAQVTIAADPGPHHQVFTNWLGDTQHLTNVTSPVTTLTMPASPLALFADYQTDTENCQRPSMPITDGATITAVGNSFIGSADGICEYFDYFTQNSPTPFTTTADCDIMLGNVLESMFDEQVINNAESGSYDIGMFISGDLQTMLRFDALYRENCMMPVVMMTWEGFNPLPEGIGRAVGLTAYRARMVEIANRMRAMEAQAGTLVVPYGVVIYDLTLNPPPSLAHLPLDYLYTPNGNVHDNVLSYWVKTNTLYAVLRNQNPTGIAFDHPRLVEAIGRTTITLNDTIRNELQQRVWRIVQEWNSGTAVDDLLVPVE